MRKKSLKRHGCDILSFFSLTASGHPPHPTATAPITQSTDVSVVYQLENGFSASFQESSHGEAEDRGLRKAGTGLSASSPNSFAIHRNQLSVVTQACTLSTGTFSELVSGTLFWPLSGVPSAPQVPGAKTLSSPSLLKPCSWKRGGGR